MNKMTFRETLVLSEARREDLKYTDKVVKNKVDRVIVELSGSDSATMTKLAGRFERLEKALKTMATKRDELKDQLKEKVTDLFNSDDVIYTRVVETTSFSMTLSKLVKSSEQDPKVVVNYEKIAEELAKLIPAELQAQVEAVTKMYTEVSIAADKAPALRVKSKVDESLNEGILDMIKGMAAKVTKWVKSMATWAVGYDRKLATLKQKAGITTVTEAVAKGVRGKAAKPDFLAADDSPMGQLEKLPQPIGINGGSYTYWVDVTKTPLKFVASDGSIIDKAKKLEDIAKWMDKWSAKIWLEFLKGDEDLENLRGEGIIRSKKGGGDQQDHERHMRG